MSFFSILMALLLEQMRPLAQLNAVHNSNRDWVRWVIRQCDTGTPAHARVAFGLAVGVPTVLTGAVYGLLLWRWGWLAAMVWSVVVLYVTLGFRQFSYHFTQIRDALYDGDEATARSHLARWMRMDASDLPRSEIVRHVMVFSMRSAHRYVFGVIAWYAVGSALGCGPAGAVLYRVAEYAQRYIQRTVRPSGSPVSPALQDCAARAWYVMDWLPVRCTALGFALAGSFEDAVQSWRQHAARFTQDNDGVVLAAAAGALDVQLTEQNVIDAQRHRAQPSHLQAVVGLVWRTVVVWMVLLAALGLARWWG